MNYSHLRFFTVIVAAAILSSCSMDHRGTDHAAITNPPEETSAEWTILYYGAGNYAGDMLSNGQSQAIATVHGLQDVYTTDKVHAVALVGTAADNGVCRFYDIRFQPGEAGNRISSIGKAWGQQDMSSPQLLKQFVDSAVALYPARHYALIIGGEGEAWRGACRDDVSGGRIMPIPAMSQTLDASTGHNGLPVHFDLLLWLTPGMSTMEVAYEMSGKVDYMVATSSVLPQPGFLASEQWLLDLATNPGMDAERLGRFMVARMATRAQTSGDTLAIFDLLDLRSVESLARDVNNMADSIRVVLHNHSSQILQIWQSLWDLQVSDSATVDLPAFVGSIRADSTFYAVEGIRQTADRVQSALDHMVIETRGTRPGSMRKGMTIYSPMTPSPADLEIYHTLRMSQEEPGWVGLLVAMQESGSALVQVHGSVTWAGHTLQNLYVFLNTAQVGTPAISLTASAPLTTIITPDNAGFQTSFALEGDSTAAYIGVFQDLDNNRQLSTGDRYGYYHRNSAPLRDWMTIRSGDELDSIQIDLTRTY
ncbi:MAG TPA: clostripain-related cysteine peptidase [bacterium]|jgi:hypothetical protein